MATVVDLSKVYEAIDNAMRETADISRQWTNIIKIMDYVVNNYTVTKQEISNAFDMEERVREYLSGIWGTSPGDSQCKQLFQYLIEEKNITKMEIEDVLDKTSEVII